MTGTTGGNYCGKQTGLHGSRLHKCGLESHYSPEIRCIDKVTDSRVRHSRANVDTLVRVYVSLIEGQPLSWRVAVPKKWNWPVGVSISNELGYQRRQYSADTWTWEIRPIVDQKVGRWYWSLNPTLDRSFHGENVRSEEHTSE